MGKGADRVEEVGAFRAEQYGSVVELMESRGGYRLSLMGKRDRDALRALLDRFDQEQVVKLALVERGRDSA